MENAVSARPTRRYPRAPVRGSAQLNLGRKRLSGEFVELSRGGAFVTEVPPVEVGTEVQGYILLPPENVPIPVTMRVLYHLPGREDRKEGMGVAFVRASGAALERISRAVDRSNLLLLQLLFSLTASRPDPTALKRMCGRVGLPNDLPPQELAAMVRKALEKFGL